MRPVSHHISYAPSAQTKAGRVVIRTMENATGRVRLIKKAQGYKADIARGDDFWRVMTQRYGLTLDIVGGSLDNIPTSGPLLTVANHPYGILDGLVMGHILSQARGDFRILANDVFDRADDVNKVILPVSFEGSKPALAQNLATRKRALSYMMQGGAIGVFPGGTVSTSVKPFGRPLDPAWRTFTAKLVTKTQANVVPIYFDGANSRLFQLASHAHPTLRLGLLINEFKRKAGKPVRVAIGEPISRAKLQQYAKDPKGMMDFLRQSTYDLSPTAKAPVPYGFEFDPVHRRAEHGGRHI